MNFGNFTLEKNWGGSLASLGESFTRDIQGGIEQLKKGVEEAVRQQDDQQADDQEDQDDQDAWGFGAIGLDSLVKNLMGGGEEEEEEEEEGEDEEVRWLRVKDGANGSELWSIYRKSMGGKKGAKTEPRRLHPLFLRDADGSAIDWNLQARLQVGEPLLPLNREGDGAQALNTYLRRRNVWNSIRAEVEHLGEQLTTYSFRHRYAKGTHN